MAAPRQENQLKTGVRIHTHNSIRVRLFVCAPEEDICSLYKLQSSFIKWNTIAVEERARIVHMRFVARTNVALAHNSLKLPMAALERLECVSQYVLSGCLTGCCAKHLYVAHPKHKILPYVSVFFFSFSCSHHSSHIAVLILSIYRKFRVARSRAFIALRDDFDQK